MKLEKAINYVEELIDQQERDVYRFKNVLMPKFENTKEVLEKLRNHYVKMQSLKQKKEQGKKVTQEEIYDAVPEELR